MSWLDILVICTLMPRRFIAKAEVAAWPLFGTLARLQRTIFIDRDAPQGRRPRRTARSPRGWPTATPSCSSPRAPPTTATACCPSAPPLIGAARDARGGRRAHAPCRRAAADGRLSAPQRPAGGAGRCGPSSPGTATWSSCRTSCGILRAAPIDAVCVWGEPVAFDTAIRPQGGDPRGGRGDPPRLCEDGDRPRTALQAS